MAIIHADKDELNFPHSPEVEHRLKEIDLEIVRRYQKEPEIVSTLAEFFNFPEERIFLETGTIGVIDRVFDSVLSADSTVLLPDLSYPYYAKKAKHSNAKITYFSIHQNTKGFSYDLNDLLSKLKEQPDILMLADPESPLGYSLSSPALQRILAACPQNTLVFLDQAHEGFREEQIKDIGILAARFPNLIVTRSFSKFYGMAGARIAFALCGKNVKRIIKFQEKYLGFDNLAQQIAITALRSTQHYEMNANLVREEKERLREGLDPLPGYNVIETDTIYSIVKVPERHKRLLAERFTEKNVMVRWLRKYHAELENFVRITATPCQNTMKIIRIFEEVAKRGVPHENRQR